MLLVLALVAILLPAVPALAGGDGPCSGVQGFDCDNMCPLAKAANTHRALGTEAPRVSALCRADLTEKVEANLARI
jgi:hypothetical protein